MADKAEALRNEILSKVEEYYRLTHAEREPFVAGSSKINYAGRFFGQEEMLNLVDSALEFWLTQGRYSKEFERRLASILGVQHCALVNSGSSANLLAFMTLTSPVLGERAIRRGDEVITVAAGFPTTVAPIVQYGAVPVFVDVDLSTCNLLSSQLEAALSSRTKAVMAAHTLGNPFDLDAVTAFCEKHGLWLIEDNCDALGSKYRGKFTGTYGDLGTSSFYPPHHITMGEGGAVYTSDPKLKRVMISLRDWGRDCWCDSGKDNTCRKRFEKRYGDLPLGYDHKYVYSHFGYNLKPTDLQAAVGLAQLDRLSNFTDLRKRNFSILSERLEGLSDQFILPRPTDGADPSWFGFLLTLRDGEGERRNRITRFLEDEKIQTRNLFAGNLLKHPCFSELEKGKDYRVIGDLAATDKIMNDSFWVGVYPGMRMEELEYMADKIIQASALD
ncbi:MAG: lipopolysaccharide biosynthesis protein RfbH [Sedimenticola sp.]